MFFHSGDADDMTLDVLVYDRVAAARYAFAALDRIVAKAQRGRWTKARQAFHRFRRGDE